MARILVVDDEVIITSHLEHRLEEMGYEVVGQACSGESAVQLARSLQPDLVLMDIVMPGRLDGIEAARIIRAELRIPVIFLTGYASEQFIRRAKTVQPLGYIVKPYQEQELWAVIEMALARISSCLDPMDREAEPISNIAASISHNLNNLLTALMLNLQMAKDQLDRESAVWPRIEGMEQAADKIRDFVQDILFFSDNAPLMIREVDLGQLLKESTMEVVEDLAVVCEFYVSHDLEPLQADPEQLRRALASLVRRATRAGGGSGATVQILAENVALERESRLPLPAGRYAMVAVQGVLPPEQWQGCAGAMEQPPAGEEPIGWLGLSLARVVARRHGGCLETSLGNGKSARYELYLPLDSRG